MKFPCSSCHASLRVADNLTGRAVKCPKCGSRNIVPPPGSPLESPPDSPTSPHIEHHTALEEESSAPLSALSALARSVAAEDPLPHEHHDHHDHHKHAPAAPHTPSPQSETPADPNSALANLAAHASAPALPYQRHGAPTDAPRYRAVEIVGWVQQILGYILMTIGLLAFLFGAAMSVYAAIQTKQLSLAIMGLTGSALWGIYLALLGLFMLGAGQLLFCVRDMARNSFHLRHLAHR